MPNRYVGKIGSVFGSHHQTSKYLRLDHAELNHSKGGFLEALKRAEVRSMIQSMGRYSTYLTSIFVHASLGNNVEIIKPSVIAVYGKGNQALVTDINEGLRTGARANIHMGLKHARELFEEKQVLLVRDLTNRSQAIVKADLALKNHAYSKDEKAQIESERALHLSMHPLLNENVFLLNGTREKRKLYEVLYDLYFIISTEDLFCLNHSQKNHDCPILKMLGEAKKRETLEAQLRAQYVQLESFTKISLNKLAESLERAGDKPLRADAYQQSLKKFPGGDARYATLIELYASHSSEALLELKVRDTLAIKLVERAIGSFNRTLADTIPDVASRDFATYANLEPFRQMVLDAFTNTTCGFNPMTEHHDALMAQYERNRYFYIASETLFYVAMGATLLFAPPVGLCGLAFAASRIAVSGAHALFNLKVQAQQKELANIRLMARFDSYESYALATSQYQSALTLVFLETYIPGYGPAVKILNRASKPIMAALTKNKNILRMYKSTTNQVKTLVAKLPDGRIAVGKLPPRYQTSFNHLVESVKPMHTSSVSRFTALMQGNEIPKKVALLTGSLITLSFLEYQKHGDRFYENETVQTNFLVTLLADVGIAFVGLSNLPALKRNIRAGGVIFVASILGQLLAGEKDARELVIRGVVESTFGITFAIPSHRFQAKIQDRALKLIPGRHVAIKGGVRVLSFSVGSLINNAVYLLGIYQLTDHEREGYNMSTWWK